jgi:3',5'-cyclic AMP phosphodiesterase CpdA
MDELTRRQFLQMTGMGGIVFMSGLQTPALARSFLGGGKDFFFVQMSDSHWGFEGAKINPDFKGTLTKAVQQVNALPLKPDFVIFTGDLIHTHDDAAVRKARMKEFSSIVAGLDSKVVHFMPGEHDAALDKGQLFEDTYGHVRYTFDHKGVHFIVIDNVTDPTGSIGEEQLEWLRADLAKQKPDANIVVFAHRPLFDLYPKWDWATKDGQKAIDLLMPFQNVVVFYGHIHRQEHNMTGHIAHHSADSLMMPMPPPGSKPKREPVAWDPAQPYKAMGYRSIESQTRKNKYELSQYIVKA